MRALSSEFPLDITATKGYPFRPQTIAKPVPIFPEVSSTTVCPGERIPKFSASSMMPNAARSFFEKPGFRYSSFARIVPFTPCNFVKRSNLTRGVFQIASAADFSTWFIIMSLELHSFSIANFIFSICRVILLAFSLKSLNLIKPPKCRSIYNLQAMGRLVPAYADAAL